MILDKSGYLEVTNLFKWQITSDTLLIVTYHYVSNAKSLEAMLLDHYAGILCLLLVIKSKSWKE